jgi:hypothetical protein
MRPVRWDARAAFNVLFVLEHFVRNSRKLKRLRIAARDRVVEHLRQQGKGQVIPVDRVRGLTPEKFRQEYLHKGIPVIMEGAAAQWRCTREWSFESWKRRFGDETIRVTERPGLSDDDYVDETELTEEMNFGAFLDQASSGGRRYIRFSPLFDKFPELRDDVDENWLRGMPDRSFGLIPQLFIGGVGTKTPLHNAMTVFFFVNVMGVKRWTFVPNRYIAVLDPVADGRGYNHSEAVVEDPDLDRFPGLDSVDRMETVMYPGDVLFNPSWNWHSVRNDSATIGIRFGMIRPTTMLSGSFTLAFVRVFGPRNAGVPFATTIASVREAASAVFRQMRFKN